jgi:hypothetical protein
MAGRRRSRRAPEPVRYGSVTTAWGKLWLAASREGIVAVSFRAQPAGRLAESLAKRVPVVLVRDPEGLAESYGKALAANPVPIVIPCHRVVESRGGLGGYTAGMSWKRRLLALERGQQVLEV